MNIDLDSMTPAAAKALLERIIAVSSAPGTPAAAAAAPTPETHSPAAAAAGVDWKPHDSFQGRRFPAALDTDSVAKSMGSLGVHIRTVVGGSSVITDDTKVYAVLPEFPDQTKAGIGCKPGRADVDAFWVWLFVTCSDLPRAAAVRALPWIAKFTFGSQALEQFYLNQLKTLRSSISSASKPGKLTIKVFRGRRPSYDREMQLSKNTALGTKVVFSGADPIDCVVLQKPKPGDQQWFWVFEGHKFEVASERTRAWDNPSVPKSRAPPMAAAGKRTHVFDLTGPDTKKAKPDKAPSPQAQAEIKVEAAEPQAGPAGALQPQQEQDRFDPVKSSLASLLAGAAVWSADGPPPAEVQPAAQKAPKKGKAAKPAGGDPTQQRLQARLLNFSNHESRYIRQHPGGTHEAELKKHFHIANILRGQTVEWTPKPGDLDWANDEGVLAPVTATLQNELCSHARGVNVRGGLVIHFESDDTTFCLPLESLGFTNKTKSAFEFVSGPYVGHTFALAKAQ